MTQPTDSQWALDGRHARLLAKAATRYRSVAPKLDPEPPSLAGADDFGADDRSQFLAMVLHELRNPLSVIRTATCNMVRDAAAGREDALSVLPVIERAVARVMDLSGDLIDLCQTTHPSFQLHCRQVDLAAAAEVAVELRRPSFERQGLLIEVVPRALPVHVMADPARLELILVNLLDNAIKYTERGGRITVLVETENTEAVLRVRDTGVGIAPDVLPFVFEPFVQERVSAGRASNGWGVGLFVMRTLVELHGGRVEASSDGRQCGSEFVVRLPAL
jgi:signal transduction histidine kinase